jgi:glycosyltransferase involved in cell wall biosynthesis
VTHLTFDYLALFYCETSAESVKAGAEISFIVITYKRGKLLQQCLNSIYAETGLPKPHEVIFVDGGGDAQIEPPSDPDIHLRLMRVSQNLGVAGGRNFGIKCAKGDYLIFINDDAVWYRGDDVSRLIGRLDSVADCGAFAV